MSGLKGCLIEQIHKKYKLKFNANDFATNSLLSLLEKQIDKPQSCMPIKIPIVQYRHSGGVLTRRFNWDAQATNDHTFAQLLSESLNSFDQECDRQTMNEFREYFLNQLYLINTLSNDILKSIPNADSIRLKASKMPNSSQSSIESKIQTFEWTEESKLFLIECYDSVNKKEKGYLNRLKGLFEAKYDYNFYAHNLSQNARIFKQQLLTPKIQIDWDDKMKGNLIDYSETADLKIIEALRWEKARGLLTRKHKLIQEMFLEYSQLNLSIFQIRSLLARLGLNKLPDERQLEGVVDETDMAINMRAERMQSMHNALKNGKALAQKQLFDAICYRCEMLLWGKENCGRKYTETCFEPLLRIPVSELYAKGTINFKNLPYKKNNSVYYVCNLCRNYKGYLAHQFSLENKKTRDPNKFKPMNLPEEIGKVKTDYERGQLSMCEFWQNELRKKEPHNYIFKTNVGQVVIK
jgi:hypothetical protein